MPKLLFWHHTHPPSSPNKIQKSCTLMHWIAWQQKGLNTAVCIHGSVFSVFFLKNPGRTGGQAKIRASRTCISRWILMNDSKSWNPKRASDSPWCLESKFNQKHLPLSLIFKLISRFFIFKRNPDTICSLASSCCNLPFGDLHKQISTPTYLNKFKYDFLTSLEHKLFSFIKSTSIFLFHKTKKVIWVWGLNDRKKIISNLHFCLCCLFNICTLTAPPREISI